MVIMAWWPEKAWEILRKQTVRRIPGKDELLIEANPQIYKDINGLVGFNGDMPQLKESETALVDEAGNVLDQLPMDKKSYFKITGTANLSTFAQNGVPFSGSAGYVLIGKA